MSIRFSQALVAIVLLIVTIALYRTASAYQATIAAGDVRMRGAAIVDRETRRLGERIAAIEALAAQTAMEQSGFAPREFAQAARVELAHDKALRSIDFFNADDVHVAHVAAGGDIAMGPPQRQRVLTVRKAEVQAVELAMFDAALSRSTSVADVPATGRFAPDHTTAHFFVATQVVVQAKEAGTIVEDVDAGRLIIQDIAAAAPSAFELDDGFGRPLQLAAVPLRDRPDTQRFTIPFGDRALQLTLAAPPRHAANPWWFALLWLALVFAIVLPMEVVGHINRRVQALNEELETRVAARTRQLEESLQESRRLAVVVETVHEGVMAIGSSGFIRYANAAVCRELQCMPHELINRPLTQVPGVGISEDQFAEIRADVSATGFIYREMERTRKDGGRYIAGVTFTRHALEDTDAIIAVSRDVTDRRQLVDELLDSKSRLERDTRTRADFIATASHELRTPVTTLRTLAALLLEKLGPRDRLEAGDQKLLDILDHETQRLARLVDDLLKMAKVDAPEAALADLPIDLCSIVNAEIEEFRRFGDGPALTLYCDEDPVVVRGDAEAVRSVVVNLITNARKFTPDKGRVDVRVEREGNRARIVVSDTGIGISKSDLPHIFERFFRAPLTASKAAGAGLGLAIVARLVELMHGTVSVASELGRGTTVTIEYPLAAVAPAADPVGRP